MSDAARGQKPRSPGQRPAYRKRVGKGLMFVGACFIINMVSMPSLPWWTLVAACIGFGLLFDYFDARQDCERELRRSREERLGSMRRWEAVAGSRHLDEVRRLRAAVEDLVGRLSPAERELLGDVSHPVASLEARVQALVSQAREVDEELRLHDRGQVERDAAAARERVAALAEGAQRVEEQTTLDVLEKQLRALDRVNARRSRIAARLRTAVGMLQVLHLDMVELKSTDLDGSSGVIQQIGEQVREVSRSVDALASALDEVMLDDLPPERSRTVAPARRPRPRRRS